MEKTKRVIFYIDGFNFYFGLKSKKWRCYYWLDVVKFCSAFLRDHQILVEVNYFSASQKDKGKHDRQDLFFTANKLNPKFNLILGKYLEKQIIHKGEKIKTFKEKQTDVNIAVKMIRDIVLDKCDISIIVSADSDLTPAIDFIREYKPSHKILVYFPPNRMSYDLKQKSNSYILLENHQSKFKDCCLPDEIKLPNGFVINCPGKWK